MQEMFPIQELIASQRASQGVKLAEQGSSQKSKLNSQKTSSEDGRSSKGDIPANPELLGLYKTMNVGQRDDPFDFT